MDSFYGLEQINRTTLLKVVRLALAADRPLLIMGIPGISKSDTVREIANSDGYALVDWRAGTALPEDLGGILWPDTATKRVDRYMPDVVTSCWKAYEATKQPVILFLDEVNHATQAVQGPLYSLVRERHSAGHQLPPGTRIIAAGNPEGTGSLAEDMSRALLDRFWVVEFAGPSIDEFQAYADKVQMHPAVRGFLADNPTELIAFDPDQHVSPTPRSWADLSIVLKSTDDLELMMQAANGHVGPEAGQRFAAYVEMFGRLPSFADIIQDPEGAKLPEDFAGQYMMGLTLASRVVDFWRVDNGRMMSSTEPNVVATRKQVHAACVWYLTRLMPELQAMTIVSLTKAKINETTMATPSFMVMMSDFRQADPEKNGERYKSLIGRLKGIVDGLSDLEK